MRDSSDNWQKILARGFRTAQQLLDYLELDQSLSEPLAEQSFSSRIPLGFAQRMKKQDPNDPLLLQVLARPEELAATDFVEDPLKEKQYNKLKGLIHKYHGRVLLTLTGACAVNCRYCFRRHFPYEDNNPGRQGQKEILDYIRADQAIHEVIFSGGDPLMLKDQLLEDWFDKLSNLEHVKTIRFHSRMPVVLPERITERLCRLFAETRFRTVMVLHCNHPNELDDAVSMACQKLKKTGCQLLNQSVLLKGINDQASLLAELSHRLFDSGVLPYYLHLLDPVKGAEHFNLSQKQAGKLFQKLQQLLPGYLLPRLAQELPDKPSKTLIGI